YDEGGQLTEAVRRKPYSVVLLDEIEKAHPDVFNILLQMLEEGRLTDAQGRHVDFRNTIVIMTSNIGAASIAKHTSLGFSVDEVAIELTEKAKDFMVDRGYDPTMGARPLRRAIQRYIEDPLADFVLGRAIEPGSTVLVDWIEGDEEISLQMIEPVEVPDAPP